MTPPLFAAIEAGGTKFVVAVGTGPDNMQDVVRIPTTSPTETLAAVTSHLLNCESKHGKISGIGVGTFGPAGVSPNAPDYGKITTTPKPGWADVDILGHLREQFHVPMAFDTDVNAAALGEWKWGAGKNCDSVLYITVGTGIGGGFCLNGQPLHGLIHPEMGHIRLPHDLAKDPFAGVCPWHGDCLEGLASGTAMKERWQQPAQDLPEDHEAWQLEAHYLGLACANFLCSLSPQKIVLGGGVMETPGLIDKVRLATQSLLNGYLRHPQIESGLSELIVAPGLGNRAGLCGSLALIMESV